MTAATCAAGDRAFVVAQANGRRVLLEIEDVVEIIPMMALAEAERVGGRCRGVAQVRGALVPVYQWGTERTPLQPTDLIVMLRQAGGAALGLAVQDVQGLQTVSANHVLTHHGEAGALMTSVSIDGEVAPVLSVDGVKDV